MLRRRALQVFGVIVALPLLYMLAAGVGYLIPGHNQSTDDQPIHEIYLYGNSFHTDIIIPTEALLGVNPDLLDRLKLQENTHIAFGWGSNTAYTDLLELTDLSPRLMLKAAWFDASVMHVTPVRSDTSLLDVGARPLNVSDQGLRRLVGYIDDTFAKTTSNELLMLPGITHGYGDAFYQARGRFHLFRTCNVWVSEALRQAGINTGIWTPFAWGLP